MGRNFDDYPGFQPKITPPKHFSPQCSVYPIERLRDILLLISYNLPVSGQVNSEAIPRSQNKQQQQKKRYSYIL